MVKILITIFCINFSESLANKKKEALSIEITQGHSRPTTINVVTTQEFNKLSEKICFNLEKCKRFKKIKDKKNADKILIIKRNIDNKIHVEILDNKQNKLIKKFLMNDLNEKNYLLACDEIYEAITHEKGIFRGKLVFSISKRPNVFKLYSINSNFTDLKEIYCQEINYLLDLFLCNNKIFVTKYVAEDKAYCVLYYDTSSNLFYNVFTIKEASVVAPVVYDREIYIAVTSENTTGIFKRPFKGSKAYSSFEEFINDPTVTTVTKMQGKIATSPTINKDKIAFCADFEGRPSIYVYPNKRISSDEGSYFDPNICDNNLAAIKIYQGQFHLVLINLTNGIEKTLLKKFFIGRPTWSPCGNWIAVSCRNRYEKDVVYLIHKTGKYVIMFQTNYEIKNIIWMDKQN